MISSLQRLARDSEEKRQKLRQAVKDLTDRSERLRAVNFKAIQKTLRQEQEIKRLREANDAQACLINGQRKQIADYKERPGEFPYAMPYVCGLERKVRNLEKALYDERNLTDTWQKTAEQAHQGRETLKRALEDASALVQQLKQKQHDQLRPILFAVADAYAGYPVTKIGFDPA